MTATAAPPVAATTIPVVADIDTGFGNATNVIHATRQYEAAGVAALVFDGVDLCPVGEHRARAEGPDRLIRWFGPGQLSAEAAFA